MKDKSAIVTIGDNCFFNNYCSINAMSCVTIGDGTIMGENVKIYDHNHRFGEPYKSLKEQGYSIGDVKIGKNCWIGSNVIILKNVVIGDNVVISAGTIVSESIPGKKIAKINLKIDYTDIIYKGIE